MTRKHRRLERKLVHHRERNAFRLLAMIALAPWLCGITSQSGANCPRPHNPYEKRTKGTLGCITLIVADEAWQVKRFGAYVQRVLAA